MKKDYLSPTLAIYEIVVEQGFAATGGNGYSFTIDGEGFGETNGEDIWVN